jgi:Uma2 family endonuclease
MAEEDAMSPTVRPDTRFTYEDLSLFPDDGKRHEIIDGKHYVTPSPVTRHQRLVQRLYFALEVHLRQHRERGEVFVAPLDVVFSKYNVVDPDLLFVAADQPEILTEKNVQGAPALVVEVLSEGTRRHDEQIKRRLFERSGVREYWLVDPELDLIKVHRRLEDGSFPRVAELAVEDQAVLSTPLLPGFSVTLSELFARPD